MQPLDPLNLKLQGQILIEASAGTGKTYTIGLLFLRLLLERDLPVDNILVVTFTKAATEELRGRVRARIREALNELEKPGQADQLLQKLIAGITNRDQAVILLTDALTRMDEAAIFTIHGFCQRMLQEHAFESGAPFEMEFLETEQLLRNRIMEDFWRLRFYHCSKEEAAWAASLWHSPQDILHHLSGPLSRPEVSCIPVIDDALIQQQMDALQPLFSQVQLEWQQCGSTIRTMLEDNKRLSRNKKDGYALPRLASALENMEQFTGSETMPWLQPMELELFTSSKIKRSLKKSGKAEPPEHPFFHLFEQFFHAHREMTTNRRFAVLLTAREYLFLELGKRKKEQAQLYFDDLLTQLDTSLQGHGGKQLAADINKRFPVIMVDEFQDTDPLQYRIFSTIHQTNRQSSGLFLIGDPKQAIYAFRGADIFTYIQARRDTATENRFTMTTNYRSTASMVAAVNQLFKRENPFFLAQGEIAFTPVDSAGMADDKPLLIKNTSIPPLTCLLLPETAEDKTLAKGMAEEHAARVCAHEIAELLTAGVTGEAHIDDRPLHAGDIAILVRTHAEADIVRNQLNILGITSVYYSQDSVFASAEASQLLIVLSCLLDLSQNARIRTALATELFGYTAGQLDSLRNDEQKWEAIMNTMTHYQQLWHRLGFIPMFQQLLTRERVVSRLHGTTTGERTLTNFLHLSELLQGAARNQQGSEGLLRWLSDQIQSPEPEAENQQLRLESDENLVKIVTIHKAKGMEYAITFLPFLWSARPCRQDEPLAFHQPDHPDNLLVDLGTGNEEHFRLAEQERLAGDLRLLYVAMTRSRYSCYFCWGRINQMDTSGLFYLLHQAEPADTETLYNTLRTLDSKESVLILKPYPEDFVPPERENSEATSPLRITDFKGHIDSSWQITSYSRLTAHSDHQPERPDYDQVKDLQVQEPGHDVFGFPKGANAGTCLHAILEDISFTDSDGHQAIISNQLSRAGFASSWQPVVESWMKAILQTELEPGFSLGRLDKSDRVNEMSFYFPLNAMDLHQFNGILEEFSFPPLPDRHDTLQGLMVGFIDLVYRHDNRYFVADYKSNHLGNQLSGYSRKNLHSAMVEHRYDLQYLIYTLALHRFLARRIQDYDYTTNLGGVYYLFLRGMDPEHPSGTGVFATRPPRELIEKLDRCCAGKETRNA